MSGDAGRVEAEHAAFTGLLADAGAEILEGAVVPGGEKDDDEVDETVDHPAKVMRIGTMLKQLLDEVRQSTLDEASRERLREIYDRSVDMLISRVRKKLGDDSRSPRFIKTIRRTGYQFVGAEDS